MRAKTARIDNKEKHPIGIIGITNTCSLYVLEIDEMSNRVKTQFITTEGYLGKPAWCTLRYDSTGRCYFNKSGTKYYMDEAMRVD